MKQRFLNGLFCGLCYSPLIDPWWMIHGNGTIPNHSPNTLPHVVMNRMLLFIKIFGEVSSQKGFGSFFGRLVMEALVWLMFLSKRLLGLCLHQVGVFSVTIVVKPLCTFWYYVILLNLFG